MNATMQPLPEIAGAVSAAAGSIQLTAGAVSSGLVSLLFDGLPEYASAEGRLARDDLCVCEDRRCAYRSVM